jgi:hypothetical protein
MAHRAMKVAFLLTKLLKASTPVVSHTRWQLGNVTQGSPKAAAGSASAGSKGLGLGFRVRVQGLGSSRQRLQDMRRPEDHVAL